ncbi:MAG: TonB-dependent receptor [Alphaproteobacteria bacterium]|nr:TonB-dependent receptor [Alphaproteobacteria bacterium]MBU2379366.1 TonB-dependent receptor [Alphaproteobacteria bacterium]
MLLSAGFAGVVQAQDQTDTEQATRVDEIVVTGIRRSVEQSIAAKRNADSVVDVITAEDIGKLPDQNIAESLARIPGVQITRRDGNGNGFTVRGISQNRILLNGRVLIGAAFDGNVSLEAVGPEILSGIEVIKSPTADLVEGALGATINLLTKSPLDLPSFTSAGRVQVGYGDLAEAFGYRASAFVSARDADRRFGALVSLGYDDMESAGFARTTGGWSRVSPAANGTGGIDGNGDGVDDPNLFRPNRAQLETVRRYDERWTLNAAVQARPMDNLELGAQLTYSDLERQRDLNSFQILFNNNDTGARALADGTVISGTFAGVTLRPLVYNSPTELTSTSLASYLRWTGDGWNLLVDASYGEGEGADSVTGNPFTAVVAQRAGRTASATYDLNGGGPIGSLSVDGNYDVNDPAQYQLVSLFDQVRFADNTGWDLKAETEVDLNFGPFTSLLLGARYEESELVSGEPQLLPTAATLLAAGDRNGDGIITVDELPGLNYDNSLAGLFGNGVSGDFIRSYPTGVIDPVAIRAALGSPRPSLDNTGTQGPVSLKAVDQSTSALYARVNFEGDLGGVPYRGNVGVRYLDTERTAEGNASAAGTLTPISVTKEFQDWLPSGNIAFDLRDDLVLRFAAAKVLARPQLAQVGPGLALSTVNFTGSRGNPDLEPFQATQYDASLEWYLAPSSLLSVAVFKKDVNSFTVQTVTEEFIPGFSERFGTFRISQPTNGEAGEVQGVEIAYQHALTFLPGPFDGFGYQLAYTYADSSTPIVEELTGETLPLPELSENSYSAVVYYEKGPLSARVAYTYRDDYLVTVQAAASGGSVFNDARGQLDASASYQLNDRIRLIVDASNLNYEPNRSFTGTRHRLNALNYEERRYFVGLSASF